MVKKRFESMLVQSAISVASLGLGNQPDIIKSGENKQYNPYNNSEIVDCTYLRDFEDSLTLEVVRGTVRRIGGHVECNLREMDTGTRYIGRFDAKTGKQIGDLVWIPKGPQKINYVSFFENSKEGSGKKEIIPNDGLATMVERNEYEGRKNSVPEVTLSDFIELKYEKKIKNPEFDFMNFPNDDKGVFK